MTAKIPDDIPAELSGDPRLVLGWRRGTALEGRRMETHVDTHADLQAVCDEALMRLTDGESTLLKYQPFSALEQDQIFRINLTEGTTSDLDSAKLIQFVLESNSLHPLDPSDLDHKFAFYAIVWTQEDGNQIGFIRKSDARASLSRGMRFFAYQETLRKVEYPDLVLDSKIDLVISGHTMFMLNEHNGRTLLADTALARADLPENLDHLTKVLGGPSQITPEARKAFEAVAARKVNFARRLAKFRSYYEGRTLSPDRLRQAAVERLTDPDEVCDEFGIICADESRAEEALDLVEGRFYQDLVSEEERRADRLTKRNR